VGRMRNTDREERGGKEEKGKDQKMGWDARKGSSTTLYLLSGKKRGFMSSEDS